jgi:hypothetical protein
MGSRLLSIEPTTGKLNPLCENQGHWVLIQGVHMGAPLRYIPPVGTNLRVCPRTKRPCARTCTLLPLLGHLTNLARIPK